MSTPLTPARRFSGYASVTFEDKPRQYLVCGRSIADEIFAAFSAFFEVTEEGVGYLKRATQLNDADCEKLFLIIQGFLRQARTFFSSADRLHHRASPLFYYYSFLNLAKARLALALPQLFLTQTRLRHGLTTATPKPQFEDELIRTSDGVFPLLYQACTGVSLGAGHEMNVVECFQYVTDVNFNFYLKKPDFTKFAFGRSRYAIDTGTSTGWILLAIGGFQGPKVFPSAFSDFLATFEEVDLDKTTARGIFDIEAAAKAGFNIFQTAATFPTGNDIAQTQFYQKLKPVFKKYFTPHPFDDEIDFVINTPRGSMFDLPWNEFFSSYALFFYLGSLVRYHPDYLEALLGKRQSWLLEQFAHSASLTLLRHFAVEILDQTYVFRSR
jgi:hypothetical protein